MTFIVLTYNEEQRLPDCLASLDGVSRKIFVVDSFSSDGTLSLLASRGVRFEQHGFDNYATQRNWAQSRNPYATEWVFHLDADERISPALRSWLLQDFRRLATSHDGFQFSRQTVFMGKRIRWGGHYPTYHLRLFKANAGICEDKVYDQHFLVAGHVGVIRQRDIIDIVASDLSSFVRSHDRWSSMEASEVLGRRGGGTVAATLAGTPIERRRWFRQAVYERAPLLSRAVLYFFYRYFLRLGFLDGKEGAIFHVLQGFWFRFLIDAKVVERQKNAGTRNYPR